MQRYLVSRVLQAIVTLFLMTIIVFGLARITGNPLNLIMPATAGEKEFARMAAYLGLDKPLPVQYWIFITHALRGDFSKSLVSKEPALKFVLQRLPATIELAITAMLIAVLIGVPLGVITAIRRGTNIDKVGQVIAVAGQSVPRFWLGIILIIIFAVFLRWLPAGARGGLAHLILPGITLALYTLAGLMRLTRSAVLDVLRSDFVTAARAKGLSEQAVIWKHVLRNALIPVVTFGGIVFGHMIMGSIVTETVFGWPGVGRLAYESVLNRDYPVIQTIVLLYSAIFIMVNLMVDISYAWLDPRIRYRKE